MYAALASIVKKPLSGKGAALASKDDPLSPGFVWRVCPPPLDLLERTTSFSKTELRALYKGFKELFPIGVASADKFCEVLAKKYPFGDTSSYGEILFRQLDTDSDGKLTFEEFIGTLDLIYRGPSDELFDWLFDFYDLDGDGVLMIQEIHIFFSAICRFQGIIVDELFVAKSARQIAQKFNAKNKFEIINKEAFRKKCSEDNELQWALKNLISLHWTPTEVSN